MEKYEILTANIDLNEYVNNDNSIIDIQQQIDSVNKTLDRYANEADKFDYAISIASGLLCGVIDSLYVGEMRITSEDIGLSHKQVNNFIEGCAKRRGIEGEHLKDFVKGLEDKYIVDQDNIWKGLNIGVGTKNHHLADIAHHPTPLGLLSAVIVQFFRVGTFVNKEGEWHFVPIETSKRDLALIWVPAIITGISNWLVYLAEKDYKDENNEELPESLHKLLKMLANAPLAIELLKCADNWYGHLLSDMAGSKQTAGAGMGIPGFFLSFAYEICSLPILKDTGVLQQLDKLYQDKDIRLNLRHELPVYKSLGKQAIPVIINDIIVRTFYFVRQLIKQVKETKSIKSLDFNKIIPFNNRTLDRMLMISSVTFTVADTADAAIRAAVESAGNFVVFSGKFVSRFNFVGAGRATLAVAKEVSNEVKEAQLIKERKLLAESKSEATIKLLDDYRMHLEALFDQYMEENLESFLLGTHEIEHGFITGNSELIIRGNVEIQSRLGKRAQFTTQSEFDDFMESEDTFIL